MCRIESMNHCLLYISIQSSYSALKEVVFAGNPYLGLQETTRQILETVVVCHTFY